MTGGHISPSSEGGSGLKKGEQKHMKTVAFLFLVVRPGAPSSILAALRLGARLAAELRRTEEKRREGVGRSLTVAVRAVGRSGVQTWARPKHGGPVPWYKGKDL